jgi:hypothetical protein
MKKTTRLLVAALLLPLHFFAQTNYKKATVILLNQQSLNGFIDYKEWDANPSSISFKDNDGVRTLTTQNVASFNIDTFENFERFVFKPKSSGKLKDIADIRWGKEYKGTPDTVFLKLITSGAMLNLYSFVGKYSTRYFIKYNKTKEITELYYDEFYGEQGEQIIETSTRFRGQLSIFAHDSLAHNQKKVMNRLQNLDYSSTNLSQVVDLLNGATSDKSTKHSYAAKLFVGVAVQESNLSYSGEFPLTNAKTSPSIRPGVNFGFDFYTNYNIRKYKVRLEAAITTASFETSTTVNGTSLSDAVYTYNHKFDQYNFSFAPQFIANLYNGNQVKFNVGAGVGINYAVYANNKYTGTYSFYTTFQNRTYEFDFRGFYISLPIRAGLVLNNRFDVYGKFTIPISSMAPYLYYSVNITSFQAGVNYQF